MDGWNDGDVACFGGIEGLKPVETEIGREFGFFGA